MSIWLSLDKQAQPNFPQGFRPSGVSSRLSIKFLFTLTSMMKKLYAPLIFTSLFTFSAPAYADCAPERSASSTVRSCESGVAVYRGQINGPDFRIVQLQQQRDIAEARARASEARAQTALRQQSKAAETPRRTGPISTGRSSFVFTPFASNSGTRGGLNFGGGLNPTGFRPSGFVGSFGRDVTPTAPLALGARGFSGRGLSGRGFSGGGGR